MQEQIRDNKARGAMLKSDDNNARKGNTFLT